PSGPAGACCSSTRRSSARSAIAIRGRSGLAARTSTRGPIRISPHRLRWRHEVSTTYPDRGRHGAPLRRLRGMHAGFRRLRARRDVGPGRRNVVFRPGPRPGAVEFELVRERLLVIERELQLPGIELQQRPCELELELERELQLKLQLKLKL